MITLPVQRISYRQKMKDKKEWGRNCVDALTFNQEILYTNDTTNHSAFRKSYNKKLSAYKLYNNILDQERYQRECDVMGVATGKFQEEIQPYNKIPTKVQVLLGEEARRPFNYQVVTADSDGIREKDAQRKQRLIDELDRRVTELIQFLQEQFSQQAQQQSAELSPEQQEELQQQIDQQIQQLVSRIYDDRELLKFKAGSYLSDQEILVAKILRYIELSKSVREKMNDGFKHGLISGEEFVWVGDNNGEPDIQVLNPLGAFYFKSPDTKYVQDGVAAGYRTMMNISDIIDTYYEFLSEEDRVLLEERVYSYGMKDGSPNRKMKYPDKSVSEEMLSRLYHHSPDEGQYGRADMHTDLPVVHAEWRSEKKIYFLSYLDPETGEEMEDMVSEDFEIPIYAEKETKTIRGVKKTYHYFDDMIAEESWIPEVWEGTKIGNDIYCNIGPKKYQFRSLDNPRKVKLGYHGVVLNATNAESLSLVERMEPFQFLFFIVTHKLKQLIAKDKPPLLHIDQSMIPEEIGVEKTMYYMNLLDIDFYNPLQNAESPGAHQRGKAVNSTQRSSLQHIMGYINLLSAIDQQISDVAGITRQREGQTGANEAVTNAQQDLAQSSTITEAVYFMPHYELWKDVLASAVDITQDLWRGKSLTKQYILDDMSLEVLKIGPTDLTTGCYNVFLSNSFKDAEVFQTLKSFIQPLIQNDRAKMSDIIKMVKATSVAQLTQEIKASELEMEQKQQEQQQHEQQMQQMQIEAQKEQVEDQQAHEMQIEQLRAQVELQKAQLQALVKLQTSEDQSNAKVAELMSKVQEGQQKLDLEFEKLTQQRELKEKEIAAKKQSKPQ